ncbi:hypothetical protein C8R45DRAFT_939442 [Mycena sanguinolenta]|nr:hypothetical protein C8R45DRAFT_939442 [Mycena sanguinolenta]
MHLRQSELFNSGTMIEWTARRDSGIQVGADMEDYMPGKKAWDGENLFILKRDGTASRAKYRGKKEANALITPVAYATVFRAHGQLEVEEGKGGRELGRGKSSSGQSEGVKTAGAQVKDSRLSDVRVGWRQFLGHRMTYHSHRVVLVRTDLSRSTPDSLSNFASSRLDVSCFTSLEWFPTALHCRKRLKQAFQVVPPRQLERQSAKRRNPCARNPDSAKDGAARSSSGFSGIVRTNHDARNEVETNVIFWSRTKSSIQATKAKDIGEYATMVEISAILRRIDYGEKYKLVHGLKPFESDENGQSTVRTASNANECAYRILTSELGTIAFNNAWAEREQLIRVQPDPASVEPPKLDRGRRSCISTVQIYMDWQSKCDSFKSTNIQDNWCALGSNRDAGCKAESETATASRVAARLHRLDAGRTRSATDMGRNSIRMRIEKKGKYVP